MLCQLCSKAWCKECTARLSHAEKRASCQDSTLCAECVANGTEHPNGIFLDGACVFEARRATHATDAPLSITGVQLCDSQKRPIDFEQDEGTKCKLLRAIGGSLSPHVKHDVDGGPKVKFEAVEEEPSEVEPPVKEDVGDEPAVNEEAMKDKPTEVEPSDNSCRNGRRSQRARKRFNSLRQRARSPGSD